MIRIPLKRLVILALISLAGTGCAFRSSPAEDRAMREVTWCPQTTDWPARESATLQELIALTPSEATMAFPVTTVVDGKLTTSTWLRKVSIVRSEICGRGIVRELCPTPTDEPNATEADRKFEQEEFGGLQFVSFSVDVGQAPGTSTGTGSGSSSASGGADDPARRRRLLTRRLAMRMGRDGTWYLMRQGTRMRVFEPADARHRGIVIHLSSLAGFDYEKPVIDELTSRGWTVLQVDASTARRQERPIEASADQDATVPAARLAKVIDERVAEVAYAAEAGLEYLDRTKPAIAGAPVVIAGYSAGALVAPAAAVLMRDRVAAIVLTGGGADLFNISRRSTLTNGGIKIAWREDPPDPQAIERLGKAYLEATHLDPYVLAPCLVDKPTLQLHGMFDDIVPADLGDLLYERLGKPERVTFTLGHRGLFWRLPTESKLIGAWLDDVTPVWTGPTNASTSEATNHQALKPRAQAPIGPGSNADKPPADALP